MITTREDQTTETADSELVTESLAGNRDAFREIVERQKMAVFGQESDPCRQRVKVRQWMKDPASHI